MRVRKLSPYDPADPAGSRDMTFGRGQSNFYRDVPEAPAQCAETRLQMFLGEWYQDLSAGTPWNTQVLGKYTGALRDPTIRTRILGTTGVRAITAYDSSLDRETRHNAVSVELDTAYGPGSLLTPSPL